MKENIAFNPMRVGHLCSTDGTFELYFCGNLVKKLGRI